MSLSANNAQTRELSELRNHLKWLDEERRKSGRKMTELEQRLAQQGRELADRDQKIQELEWHVANFAERFERLPEAGGNAASVEQRLQDLEWHLSNMNTQLTQLPNMEQERARLLEEITRTVSAAQEQAEAGQSMLESRLRAEIINLQNSEQSQILAVRQEEQARAVAGINQTIDQMGDRFASLQENVGVLSAQLQERTVNLAAESQANISSLASRLQDYLDTMAAEQQSRIDVFTTEWQSKLDALPEPNADLTPEIGRLEEQLSTVTQTQQQWEMRWAHLEQQIDAVDERLLPISTQQGELAAAVNRLPDVERQLVTIAGQLPDVETQLAALATRIPDVEMQMDVANRLPEVEAQLTALAERLPEVEAQLTALAERLPEVEAQLTALAERRPEVDIQLAALSERLPDVETQLAALADHLPAIEAQLGATLEESAARAAQQAGQIAQLEENISKLGHVREIMPLLDRLEQELELRQAEEVRLSNLIGTQENRFAPLAAMLEDLNNTTNALVSRVSDSERLLEELRANVQDFNDNWKPAVTESNRRLAPLAERLTIVSNSLMKAEAGLQALGGDQSELREAVTQQTEDIRRNQRDVVRQLEGWQAMLDENKDTIERFTQQWITLSNQYKEARMAVQNFAHWQKQLEQQKREASEMLRVESNRMQSRWDGFLLEVQEKLKNFELDLSQKWQAFELENEQKWAGARRGEQLWREELASVDELIQKLQQDNRNLIWRVQSAQADAIKKWPRLLMEEVEKAVELNPNRRLSSAVASPRADISVVDAIEQGLITIDYNDDSAIEL
jgi:chromosome segregation ATPase